MRRVDTLSGFLDRVPQALIGVAEIGLVMPDQRERPEVLRAERASLARLTFRGTGDARHAVADPRLPSRAEASEMRPHARRRVGFQGGQPAGEQRIQAVGIEARQREGHEHGARSNGIGRARGR